MLENPAGYFLRKLSERRKLCLLPITRLSADTPVLLADDLIYYPENFFETNLLNVVWEPKREFENLVYKNSVMHPSVVDVAGVELHWMKSAVTQVSASDFFSEGLLAFPIDMDWNTFLAPISHEFHLSLISKAASQVEKLLNLIRFDYCRIDLMETLPGKAGLMRNSSLSSALFYTLDDHESYIIAGDVVRHAFVAGIGLQIDGCKVRSFAGGEVYNIASHALQMHTDALEASNYTAKFINLINLLDYLAEPFDFLGMAKAKGRIARHIARSTEEYEKVIEDFKFLTSKINGLGNNIGLRHNIIHTGARIEELLSAHEVKDVLRRMDRYASAVIEDLLEMSTKQWSDVETLRLQKGKKLGLDGNL